MRLWFAVLAIAAGLSATPAAAADPLTTLASALTPTSSGLALKTPYGPLAVGFQGNDDSLPMLEQARGVIRLDDTVVRAALRGDLRSSFSGARLAYGASATSPFLRPLRGATGLAIEARLADTDIAAVSARTRAGGWLVATEAGLDWMGGRNRLVVQGGVRTRPGDAPTTTFVNLVHDLEVTRHLRLSARAHVTTLDSGLGAGSLAVESCRLFRRRDCLRASVGEPLGRLVAPRGVETQLAYNASLPVGDLAFKTAYDLRMETATVRVDWRLAW